MKVNSVILNNINCCDGKKQTPAFSGVGIIRTNILTKGSLSEQPVYIAISKEMPPEVFYKTSEKNTIASSDAASDLSAMLNNIKAKVNDLKFQQKVREKLRLVCNQLNSDRIIKNNILGNGRINEIASIIENGVFIKHGNEICIAENPKVIEALI